MRTRHNLMIALLAAWALAASAASASAQVLNAPSRLTSAREPGVYERLLVKNRARYFGGQVSPSGELYLYLDDSQLQAAGRTGDVRGLSPTVTDTDGVRKISLSVVSRVPQTLRVDRRQGSELEIGVVRLPEERGRRRPIEIDSVIDLAPLRIHGSGGARRAGTLDGSASFLDRAGGRDR